MVQAFFKEKVYIKLPSGCGELTGKSLELNKSFYYVEQASHEFQKFLTGTLLYSGLEQCLTDTFVSRMVDSQDPSEVRMILLCHIDDLMVAGSSSSIVNL